MAEHLHLTSATAITTDHYILTSAHVTSSEWFFLDLSQSFVYHDLYVNANFASFSDLIISPPHLEYYSCILNREIYLSSNALISNFLTSQRFSLNYTLPFVDIPIPPASLILGFCSNYFHWVFDVLPRLFCLSEYPFRGSILTSTLLKLSSFQFQYLSLLGIRDEQVFSLPPHMVVSSTDCYFPSCRKNDIFGGSNGSRTVLVNRLRKYIINQFCSVSLTLPSRFFISRSHNDGTRLIRYKEIEDFYHNLGFSIIALERISVKSQIQLFHNAKVIVGSHGAGWSNVIFCQPGALMIELYDESSPFYNGGTYDQCIRKGYYGRWITDVKLFNYITVNCSLDSTFGSSFL